MELKLSAKDWQLRGLSNVLIVPLWNWNLREWSPQQTVRNVLIVPLWNWNRIWSNHISSALSVLIVPLWNWNAAFSFGSQSRFAVLIVPLWNWNVYEITPNVKILGSNRTFMELKSTWLCWVWSWFSCSNRTFMELKCWWFCRSIYL